MGGTQDPVCWSFIGSSALSTRPLGSYFIYIGELLFKSGFEFEKEFHLFGLAFKKSLTGLLHFGKLVKSKIWSPTFWVLVFKYGSYERNWL